MAETVGVVASVLTLLGCTVRTLSLISRLKDAPTSIRSLAMHVKQLEEVIQTIQGSGNLGPNPDPVRSVLQDCEADIAIFQKRLEALIRNLDGKKIRRTWATVLGVVKEKEFEEAVNKIERHKTNFLLVLQNQNLFVDHFAAKMQKPLMMRVQITGKGLERRPHRYQARYQACCPRSTYNSYLYVAGERYVYQYAPKYFDSIDIPGKRRTNFEKKYNRVTGNPGHNGNISTATLLWLIIDRYDNLNKSGT